MRMGPGILAVAGGLLTTALVGCSGSSPEPAEPRSSSSTTAATAAVPGVHVVKTLASGLQVPWGIAFLPDGSALVAERPTGRVLLIGAQGGATAVGTVPGVRDFGEGGLLGLALEPSTGDPSTAKPATLFAYLTSTSDDNRVLRMTFDGSRLGPATPVLTGIPSANHHDGGLITIGPDGKLWIGTGEGGATQRAQNRSNLGGKILRINLDGTIPTDNPFPGSAVYSLGHRNVQGLAFDSSNQPWAIEFGQNTWDELNRIVAGGNYGWPEVEGKAHRKGFIDPLVQWPTSDASPSGMAIVDDVAYIGGLRGERLWQVPLHGTTVGTPKAYLTGQFGRIRNVCATRDGQLWITTSNRDGRGDPGPDDDRVILLSLS
jgi:aldose sugar dehydrogenase